MTIGESLALGAIQGLTEFLPISSTAHLLAARKLFGHAKPGDAFTTAIQIGTLLAVLWYFRYDCLRLTRAWIQHTVYRSTDHRPDARLCWQIVVGTIPVVVVGLLGRSMIKQHLYDLYVMAGIAVIFSLLMYEAEATWRDRASLGNLGRDEHSVRWRDALVIGLFQAMALIPGASRSGCTMTAARLMGLSRTASARFSFLLSLPSVLGAGCYELYKDRHELFGAENREALATLGLGTLAAAIVGYLAIAWLMRFLRTRSLIPFVIYRIVLAAIIVGLLWANVIATP